MKFVTARRLLCGVSTAALALGIAHGEALAADCTAGSETISADCTDYANAGTLGTLTVTATISSPPGADEARALDNSGTITTIDNDGTISAVNDEQNNAYGIYNAGTITGIDNDGTISGTIDRTDPFNVGRTAAGIWNAETGSIGSIVNDSTIFGVLLGEAYYQIDTYGILNNGAIASITNNGDILGKYGIYSQNANADDATTTISELHNNGTISGVYISLGTLGVVETIDNTGSITVPTALFNFAAMLLAGGTVEEIANSGTIDGGEAMPGTMIWGTGVGSIENDGTISGKTGLLVAAFTLGDFVPASIETLHNGSDGKITGNDAGISVLSASVGLLTNDGEISGTGDGNLPTEVASGLGITLPGSFASLTGNGAIVALGSEIGTIQNNGTLSSTADGSAAAVLGFGSTFEAITNAEGATMSASGNVALGIGLIGGSADALTNDGGITVTGTGEGSLGAGLVAVGSKIIGYDAPAVEIGTLTNPGTVSVTGDIALGAALSLASIEAFDNSGTLSATGTTLGAGLVAASVDFGSFTNSGTIAGAGPYSGGMALIGLASMVENLDDAGLAELLGGADNPLLLLLGALDDDSLATPASIDTFLNEGTISGGLLGLYVGGGATVGSFENSGTIESGSVALYLDGGAELGEIDNSGTISGPQALAFYGDAIFGTITNTGTIAGTINNSTDAESFFVGGSGDVFGRITGYSADPLVRVLGLIDSPDAGVTFVSGNTVLDSDINAGANTVANDGTLRLDDTISITGNYTQSASGRLVVTATSDKIGALLVSGAADLTGSTIVILPIGGYKFSGGDPAILGAAALAIDGLTVKASTETITFETVVDGDVTRLLANLPDLGPSSAYADIGAAAGPLGAEMGRVLDVLAGGDSDEAIAFQGTVLAALLALDEEDQPAAIAALAPSPDTPRWQIGFAASSLFADAVAQRQFGRIGGPQTEVSAYAGTPAQPAAGAWQSLLDEPGAFSDRFAGQVWGQVLGGLAEGPGYRLDGGGLAIGADVLLSDAALVGIAGSWLSVGAEPGSAADAASEQENLQALFYGTWRPRPFYISAEAGFGVSRTEQSRTVDFLGDVAEASFDGSSVMLRAEAGYDLPLATGAVGTVVLTPLAGIDFLRSSYDGYTETGAGAANLTVDGQSVSSLTSTLGAKLSRSVSAGNGRLTTEVRAAWLHEHLSDPVITTGSLAGSDFTVVSDRISAEAAELGLSISIETAALLFGAEYVGQFRSDYESHSGLLKGALRF